MEYRNADLRIAANAACYSQSQVLTVLYSPGQAFYIHARFVVIITQGYGIGRVLLLGRVRSRYYRLPERNSFT